MPSEKPLVAAVLLKSIVPSLATRKLIGGASYVGNLLRFVKSEPSRYVENTVVT